MMVIPSRMWGGFVGEVFVGADPAAGGDGEEVHAEGLRANRFAADAFVVGEALFAGTKARGAKFAAFVHRVSCVELGGVG